MDKINVTAPRCPACGSDHIELQEGLVEHLPFDGVSVVTNEITVKLSAVLLCMRCEWAEELHLVHLEAA
jgi:hypothetical protein